MCVCARARGYIHASVCLCAHRYIHASVCLCIPVYMYLCMIAGAYKALGAGVTGAHEPPDMGAGKKTQVHCKSTTHA